MNIAMPLQEMRDGVLTLTLNRPEKLNALTPEIYTFIGDQINRASDDPECVAIVLRGNGRAFSSGFDLKLEMGERTHEDKLHALHEVANRARWAVWNCKKPVIAGIHGYCMGGAFELVLPCDFTIATESCRLGEPEILFGAGPAFSSSGQQTAPGEADFAVFKTPDTEIALTSLPWVDEPLVFLIDKLGGRNYYAAMIQQAFPDGWVVAEREG